MPTFMSCLAGVMASDMEEAQESGYPWRRKETPFVDGPVCAVWHQITLTTTECVVMSPHFTTEKGGSASRGW